MTKSKSTDQAREICPCNQWPIVLEDRPRTFCWDTTVSSLSISFYRHVSPGCDGWMDGRKDGWTDGRMDGWRDGGMEGWRDGGMDGWMDGSMYVCLNVCMFVCLCISAFVCICLSLSLSRNGME